MSDLDVGSIGVVRGDPEQRALAMRAVASRALDGEDCLSLLYELGLLEDPLVKPKGKGRA